MKTVDEALLIVGHGTKSEAGIRQFKAAVSMVNNLTSMTVEYGFIELAEPTIEEAISTLLEETGLNSIAVIPLLLLAAGHVKNDVPAAIERARTRYPKVSFRYTKDLSITPELLDIVEERARFPFNVPIPNGLQTDSSDYSLIVGRGSTDPDANSDLFKIARLLTERGHMGQCEPAFISLADPNVTAGLDRLKILGANIITISPYFLFSGALLDRIYAQAVQWHNTNPRVDIRLAREMGPDPRIAELIVRRADERIGHMMNCDMCVYRASLPGHEHKVGQSRQSMHHLH